MSSKSETLPASTNAALDESLVGRMVGKYEIVRVLGRGGMGMVYEALNTSIGKRVAMKFVDAELSRNRDSIARFQREAQAASAVESAHIVEIFDSGVTDDGLPFIVMELLRGEDLGHRIKRCGRLELPEAAHITSQILRGLHRAHEAGIVHRDLKPDNIFLVDRDDDANFAKILDFGISKVQRTGDVPAHTLTRQGTVLGTPFYMSPEQAQALNDVDGRTDIWAAGAILYECLTGRPPHTGSTYEQVIVAICMKDADDVRLHNPGVPEPVARVISRALTRDRAGRFANAREFLDSLTTATGGTMLPRSGRGSGDDLASGRAAGTMLSPGQTPMPTVGYEPTLAMKGNPAASRVGWSTTGGSSTSRSRDRRTYLIVAAFLGIGAALGFAYMRATGALHANAGPTASSDVEVHLRSDTPDAHFFVGSDEIKDGTLHAAKGEHRLVRVEAPGFDPAEHDVAFDQPHDERLDPKPKAAARAPEVTPAAVESAATAAPTATAAAKAARASTGGHAAARPPAPVATAHADAPPPAPRPQGGVAPGLTIKTD